MNLPVELREYVWKIYYFNLQFRVRRNWAMLMRNVFYPGPVYFMICPFSKWKFHSQLNIALRRRMQRKTRKQISARSFYKSLKPQRFFDI
jgi:hypothetical protein